MRGMRPLALAALLLALPAAVRTEPAPPLPSIDAIVVRHDPARQTVELNKGTADGVVIGMEFTVYGRGGVIELPLTGEAVLRAREPIGTLHVRAADEHRCTCEVSLREGIEENLADLRAIGLPVRTEENLPPQIRGVTLNPAEGILQGTQAIVRVDATDADGDRITYDWSASEGRLSWARSSVPYVRWIAPLRAGEQTLTVEARDERGMTSRRDTTVTVGGESPDAAPFRLLRTVASRDRLYGAVTDITVDDEGNLFLVDPRGKRIHKCRLQEGDFVSFGQAGRTEGQLGSPQRIAYAHDEVAVLDTDRRRVLRYNKRGEFIRELCADAEGNGALLAPIDLAVSPRGEIYVLEGSTRDVRVFAPSGEFVLRFGNAAGAAGTGVAGAFASPVAIDCDLRGNLYVLDNGRKSVHIFGPDHRFLRMIPAREGTDLCVGPTGRLLYIAGGGTLDRIVLETGAEDGEFTRVWGQNPGWTRTDAVGGATVACDPLGRVWMAGLSRTVPSLRRYGTDGTFDRMHGGEPIEDPLQVACGDGGLCYVLDGRTSLIHGLTPEGWSVERFGGRGRNDPQFLQEPRGLVAIGENVFVLDHEACRIKQYASGRFVREIGTRGNHPGEMDDPRWIATDRDGGFILLDLRGGGNALLRFDAAGAFRGEIYADGPREPALKREPRLLSVAPDGRTVVCNGRPPHIHLLDANYAPVERGNWGPRGREPGEFRNPVAMEVGPLGRTVWIADRENANCQRCRLLPDEFGKVHLFTIDRAALGNAVPRDLAVDPFNRLYVLTEAGTLLLFSQ